MLSKRKLWVLPLALAPVLAAASVAVAASSGQTYSQKFTVKHPGRSTGVSLSAAGPVQANTVTLTFPAGTKIRIGAVTKCATPPNCPASSKIGTGTANVSFAGATLPQPVAAYNRAGGMYLMVTTLAGAPPLVLPATLSGRSLQVALPSLSVQGLPLTVAGLQVSVAKHGTGQKAYITTPPTCPSSGHWTFVGKFTYPAAPAQTIKSQSACTKH